MSCRDLRGIKLNNTKKIIDVMMENDYISISKISKAIGVSCITIGKIMETLLLDDIVVSKKSDVTTVGRKAQLYTINTDSKYILVITLTSLNIKLDIKNCKLDKLIDTLDYKYNDSLNYETNLQNAINIVKNINKEHLNCSKLIGVGVITPGPYFGDRDEVINSYIRQIDNVHLMKFLKKHINCSNVYIIDEDVNFAAKYYYSELPICSGKLVYYMNIGKEVSGAIIRDGSMLLPAYRYSGKIGMVFAQGDESIEEVIKREIAHGNKNRDKIVACLVKSLEVVAWLIDPDIILLDVKMTDNDYIVFNEAKQMYMDRLASIRDGGTPELIVVNGGARSFTRGCAGEVYNKYIDKIITLKR